MAWTTPRTWVANETVTAALMNTHVRDNLAYLEANAVADVIGTTDWPLVHAELASNVALSASTWTKVTFGTENIDTAGAFSTGRFTVPTGADGLYFAQWHWTLSTLSGRTLSQLYKNGASQGNYEDGFIENTSNSTFGTEGQQNGFTLINLTAGDYVEPYAWALNAAVVNDSVYGNGFSIWRVA